MADRINVFELWSDEARSTQNLQLQTVRLDGNETVVIPFTSDGESVNLHYCDQAEIRNYVHCNDKGCVLCKCGRKPDARVLLPVYLPETQTIAVLPIPPGSRPGSLRPLIMPILRSDKRFALLISKPDRTTYRVSSVELTDSMDDGTETIKQFQDRWDKNEVDLGSVYMRLDNQDLAEIPGIAALLQFKGVTVNDAN